MRIWKQTLNLVPQEDLLANMHEIVGQHPRVFRTPINDNDIETSITLMQKDLETYQKHGHQNTLELSKLKQLLETIRQAYRKIVAGKSDWRNEMRRLEEQDGWQIK